jgi:hypothetical protein
MAKKHSLTVCRYVLAAVLLALATPPSYAEDAGQRAADTGASAKDASSPDTHAKEHAPIDMSVSVQPRRSLKSEKPREPKITVRRNAPANFRAQPALVPVTRNAIGLSVATRSFGLRSAVEGPGIAPIGAGQVFPAKPFPNRANSAPPNASPVAISPATNRGTISGTGVSRRGLAPASIGGPPKTSGAINGTTIRPKR